MPRASRCLSVITATFLLLPGVQAAETAANVTTVAAPGGGQPIVARCDAAGVIHVVCDSPKGPQYATSTDNGRTFSRPLAIVDRATQKPGLEFNAWDMVVGKGGRVHVVMGTNAWKLKLPQDEWGFQYANIDRGATAFSPVRNITRHPGEGYSLAADEQGNVTICWMAGKLYTNISHDNGETFTSTAEIDSQYDPCNCCTTSSAYAGDGRLAVLYREETNNDRDMFLILWDQARNQSARTKVSTTNWNIDACPMSYYTIRPTADGFTAVWPTKGQIYFGKLDAKGNLLPPGEIKVPGTTGMRTGMFTLSDADGNTLVAWKKNNLLSWQLYDVKGREAGSLGSAKSQGNGAAGVVTKDGRFLLIL